MNKIKVVFAGTPNFSVPTFNEIIKNFEVVALISQPSKPVGRKQIIQDPPTVVLAKQHGIKIFQPNKIKEIYGDLSKLNFDIFITMAFGQIVPENILKLAKHGSYNVHGSLLPKYRGASPIQYSLMNGDEETGITFMEMVKEMDAGDIIFQEAIKIDEFDNYETLSKKMSDLSANNISNWINKIVANDFKKTKQVENNVTYCPKIAKEEEELNLELGSDKVINKIRALSPVPGAYILLNEKNTTLKDFKEPRLKVFNATKIRQSKNSIELKCSDCSIFVDDYQFAGKNRVKIK